ncbi:hypothetical protein [Streptomyces sp. NPDC003032]
MGPGGGFARADLLETLLGDPYDSGNPTGLGALLGAEGRGERHEAAEEVLGRFGLGAESVPTGRGGRLARADELAAVLAPVFRRDLSVGFGYGVTSLFAALPVWAAGSSGQRGGMANLLRTGGRAAIVHHASSRGNALYHGEMTVWREGGRFVVDGRKDVVMNADRAELFTVYARNATPRGSG